MADPDWWTPPTDDYADTYDETPRLPGLNDDLVHPTLGEVYAETDAEVRFTIERGRPGYVSADDA